MAELRVQRADLLAASQSKAATDITLSDIDGAQLAIQYVNNVNFIDTDSSVHSLKSGPDPQIATPDYVAQVQADASTGTDMRDGVAGTTAPPINQTF